MTDHVPSHVVFVKLDEDAGEIETQAFSSFQRLRVRAPADGMIDASRIVVVASFEAIHAHTLALERVLAAQSVDRVICVLRGSHLSADETISLTPQLNLAPVAAIWVDDPRGVVWSMRTAKARALTVYDGDPDGDAAFELLIDCLRLPEVFDDVFAKAKESGTVVSPALRVFVPGATDARLNETAELTAVSVLTSGGRPDLEISMDYIPGDLEARSFLFGQAPVPVEFFDGQGKVGQLSREIDTRLAQVDEAVKAITEHPPMRYRPIERANGAIRAVGDALAALKRELMDLFGQIDGSNGLNAEEVKKLRSAGLRSGSTKAIALDEPDEAEGLLRNHALSELRRTSSLQAVVSDLRRLHERGTPRTPRETLELLDGVAPDSVVERMRRNPPLRVSISDWQSLLLIFVACTGAAGTWAGAWLFVVLALLALGAFFYGVTRPISEIRGLSISGARHAAARSHIYLVTGSAIFGLAAGFSIRSASGSIEIHVLGALVAIVTVPLLAFHAWRAASRRWLETADPVGAGEVAHRALELTADVAMNDWVLAETRVRFAGVAEKLSASLEALRIALLGDLAPTGQHRESLEQPAQGVARAACNPAVRADLSNVGGGALYKHSAKLEEIVLDDYLDTLAATVEENWAQVAAGDQQTGERAVLQDLRRRLSSYRDDLRRNGLFGSRVWIDGRDEDALSTEGRVRRRDLLAELWASLDLGRLLNYAADAELVQLCSAEMLVLLGQDPTEARLVRFAPATPSGRQANEIVRTNSMLMAGVIRLVPLRSGTVEFEDLRTDGLPAELTTIA